MLAENFSLMRTNAPLDTWNYEATKGEAHAKGIRYGNEWHWWTRVWHTFG